MHSVKIRKTKTFSHSSHSRNVIAQPRISSEDRTKVLLYQTTHQRKIVGHVLQAVVVLSTADIIAFWLTTPFPRKYV